jgi:hypothetical protein
MCPVIELTLGRTLDVVGKFLDHFVVKNRVLAEPYVHAAVYLRRTQLFFHEPEGQYFIDADLVVVSDGCIESVAKKFYCHVRMPLSSRCFLNGLGRYANRVTEKSRSDRS